MSVASASIYRRHWNKATGGNSCWEIPGNKPLIQFPLGIPGNFEDLNFNFSLLKLQIIVCKIMRICQPLEQFYTANEKYFRLGNYSSSIILPHILVKLLSISWKWIGYPIPEIYWLEISKMATDVDLIEPEIGPFDPPSTNPPPNQTWSGSDDPLPRYVRLNFSNMVAIKDTRKVFAPNQGYFGVGQSNGVVQISVRLTLIAMASNWFYLDTKSAITQLVWGKCKKTFQFETHCKDDVMISIY